MSRNRRLTPVVLVASVLTACASPAPGDRGVGPESDAPPFAAASGTAGSPGGSAAETALRGPGFDLLAAVAAIDDRARGSDGAAATPDARLPADGAAAWRFSFAPYFWLFDIDGSVQTKGGETLPVSAHLHDTYHLVKDHIDPSFAGHFEGTDGNVTFFLDGNYIHLSGDGGATITGPLGRNTLSADLEVDVKLVQAEVGLAYPLGEFRANAKRSGTIELIGGARWNSLEIDTDLEISGRRVDVDNEVHRSSGWVDPFLGARTRVPLCEEVDFSLRADIGGGVGDGSDRAWNVVTGIVWKLSECTDVFLGYRWYDMERGSGGRDSDLQFEGPGAGVVLRF